jgi:hypothetical protein
MSQCQEVANGYIKSKELRGIQIAKLILNWHSIKGYQDGSILPSLSQALNTYLSAHMDNDFFYSLMTTACCHALRDDIDQYKLHAEVSNYFVFQARAGNRSGIKARRSADIQSKVSPLFVVSY